MITGMHMTSLSDHQVPKLDIHNNIDMIANRDHPLNGQSIVTEHPVHDQSIDADPRARIKLLTKLLTNTIAHQMNSHTMEIQPDMEDQKGMQILDVFTSTARRKTSISW